MKRIATLFAVVGVGLIALAPVAGASKPGDDDSLPNGTQLKTDICHWANGHPHIVPISISATAQPQEVQHGTLTLTEPGNGFGSFVAHDTNGHEGDFVARIYTKHGNDETNTYVSEKSCDEEETTTTTEPEVTTTTVPEVTTTTQPEVTTTTEPPVVTTTTEPVVTTTTNAPVVNNPAPPATDTPAPVAEVPVVAPVSNTPAEPLAETGANSLMIAMLGAGLASIGIALKMFGKSISSN